ncbi:MAG: GNAT family N-acetyltransferase [Staphylothermus sp.]|nr:GNAT family N-acetyltransferase [Staphylothermus sp.]
MKVSIVTLKERELTIKELVNVINSMLYYDIITPDLVRNNIELDPFTGPEQINLFIDIDTDEVLGILWLAEPKNLPKDLKKYETYLWVKLVGVVPRYEELLKNMLGYLEEYALSKGKNMIRLYGYAPYYIVPGLNKHYELIDDIIRKSGYDVIDRVVNYYLDAEQYYVPLRYYWLNENLSKKGYKIREVSDKETLTKSKEWIMKKFGLSWSIEAEIAYNSEYGGLLIATKNNEIVGFSVYSGLALHRFGPIGVSKEHRGIGLGEALMHYCLEKIKLNGSPIIEIPWTTHLFFYAGLPGLYRVKTYYIYEKKLIR